MKCHSVRFVPLCLFLDLYLSFQQRVCVLLACMDPKVKSIVSLCDLALDVVILPRAEI